MRKKLLTLSVAAATLFGWSAAKAQEDESMAKKDPVAYFLGVSVGQSLAGQGFTEGDFSTDVLAVGVKDGLTGADLALSGEQLQAAQKEIETMMKQRAEKKREDQKQAAQQWLKENAGKEGVKVLESGVQYKVLEKGDGKSPTPSDTVKVHYTGKLTDGTVFDSSRQRGEPATFQVGQVIKGWQLALQKMKVGSKWMLYIPPELAYGEQGAGQAIGPNEVLIFEVELLEIL